MSVPDMSTWIPCATAQCRQCGAEFRRDSYGRRESDWIISADYCSVPCNLDAINDARKTPISRRVIEICTSRFTTNGTGCASCPIRPECHSSPAGRLTHLGMDEWRQRMNEAAERVVAANAAKEG